MYEENFSKINAVLNCESTASTPYQFLSSGDSMAPTSVKVLNFCSFQSILHVPSYNDIYSNVSRTLAAKTL